MNVKSKALRAVGVFFAVILSIVLVALLIVVPTFSVVTTITQPDVITDVLQQIDIGEMLLSDESIQNALETEDVPVKMVQELIDSSVFKETVGTYVDNVKAEINGEIPAIPFGEDFLTNLTAEHKDEFTALIREHVPEAAQASDAEIQQAVDAFTEQYTATFMEMLPTGEALQQMLQDTQLMEPLSAVMNSTVSLVLYGIVGVLAVLVFLCLLHRFGGMLCLGINSLVATVPLVILYALLGNGGLLATLLEGSEVAAILQPVISVLSGKLMIAILIMAIAGILLITGYVLYNQLVFKKKYMTVPVAAPAPATTSDIPYPLS